MSPNMPMRISDMVHLIGRTFMAMENDTLLPEYEKILYKCCLDSIPKGRRMALQQLARFEFVTTRGLAINLGYGTDRVRMWLEELNVLNLCTREVGTGGAKGDKWTLNPNFKRIMLAYDNIKETNEALEAVDSFDKEVEEFNKGNWDQI